MAMELQTTIEDKKTNFEYLGNEHFALTLVATLLLHILAGYGIYSMPKAKILDIPVRMLNIRLGDADMQEEEATQPQPISENSPQLESEMARLSRPEQQKETSPKPTPPKQEKQPVANNSIPAPRQFVRTNAADNIPKNEGVDIGNSSAKNAEIKANYEQTVSLWIKKFQVYPEEVRQKGYVGVPVVRVRFDLRGNIRKSLIETTSGYEELDRAALDGVRRANPVPAVPDDYPQVNGLVEFLIPVNFSL